MKPHDEIENWPPTNFHMYLEEERSEKKARLDARKARASIAQKNRRTAVKIYNWLYTTGQMPPNTRFWLWYDEKRKTGVLE
jgi:hypothetical protein